MEGEIGRFRRTHLVPVPDVTSLAELNVLIAAGDVADDARVITGRPVTVGAGFAAGLALGGFEAALLVSDRGIVCVIGALVGVIAVRPLHDRIMASMCPETDELDRRHAAVVEWAQAMARYRAARGRRA